MSFIDKIAEGNFIKAKEELFKRLNEIAALRLGEAKKIVASETFEVFEEAVGRNPNIVRMGRIQKIRRRIRRNTKGKIVVQKNVRRSGVKGYRVAGSTLKRIPAAERLRKARKLKQSWKTTRRAKLRRTLMKRKMSLRRRAAMGLR